jgi:hypothetical protein
VRTSIAPLLQKSAASQTGNGISFLQVKNMLLLSYCTNLCFFLLLKSEGKPVQDHPVVLQLARFRTILDKMRPVEKKIRYQVNKLLSDQANKADDLSYKPDVSAMDVEDEASSGDDSAEDNAQSQFGADATGVYKVNKQASFDTFEKESMLAKRKLEREKEKLRANPWVQHMRDEIYGDKPEVVDAFGVGNKDDEDSEDVERRNYEESNYMRLTETKKDKKRKAAKKQKSSMADFDDFGDLEAFTHRQERVTDERRADQGHGGFTMDLDGYGGNDEQDRKNAKRKRKEMSQADQDEGMDFYREMAAKASDKRIQKKAKYVKPQSLLEEQDPFAIDQGDRRKITTKMDKNRGLMRYRNSDIKTSRMRYRKQYEKALTKRRREVSEFKGAPDKYSGEKSGLKPTTIKSTKL